LNPLINLGKHSIFDFDVHGSFVGGVFFLRGSVILFPVDFFIPAGSNTTFTTITEGSFLKLP
jgi:hypothetical protein